MCRQGPSFSPDTVWCPLCSRTLSVSQRVREQHVTMCIHNMIKPSEENVRLRQGCPTHSLNWTDENGRCRVLTELFPNGVSNLIPGGWNFIRRISKLFSPKGKKRIGCAPQASSRRSYENLSRNSKIEKGFATQSLTDLRHLRIDELATQEEEGKSKENQLKVQIQELQD